MPYDRERDRIKNRNKRDEKKRLLAEHFGDMCVDCGQSFPICCYDYHHKNPEEKKFELGTRLWLSLDELIKEGDKCVMLCSNCHRIRHHKEDRHAI